MQGKESPANIRTQRRCQHANHDHIVFFHFEIGGRGAAQEHLHHNAVQSELSDSVCVATPSPSPPLQQQHCLFRRRIADSFAAYASSSRRAPPDHGEPTRSYKLTPRRRGCRLNQSQCRVRSLPKVRKRRHRPPYTALNTGWRSTSGRMGHYLGPCPLPGHGWLREGRRRSGSVRVSRAIVLPNAARSTAQGSILLRLGIRARPSAQGPLAIAAERGIMDRQLCVCTT